MSFPGPRRFSYRVSQALWVAACLAPALMLFTIVVAYPIAGAMAYSLFRWDGIVRSGFVGLVNFQRLLTQYPYSVRMLTAFWHNVWTFALTMVIQNGLGLLFAMLLAGRTWGAKIYRAIFFMPVTLSLVIVGFLWQLFLNPVWGIVNKSLALIGLGGLARPWLGDVHTALIAITLVNAWRWVGFPTIVFLAGIQAIPDEYLEAARLDGAGPGPIFRRVVLPLLAPQVNIIVILTFIGALRDAGSDGRAQPRDGRARAALLSLRVRRGRHRQSGCRDRFIDRCDHVYVDSRGQQPWRHLPAPARGRAVMLPAGRTRSQHMGGAALAQTVLFVNTLLVLLPMVFMVLSSLKTTREIFQRPFSLPANLAWQNYSVVWEAAHFSLYFRNSVIVTVASMVLILVTSTLAAYALGRYQFRGNDLIYLYFLTGIMVPIRLAIIPLFILMRDLRLLDTYWSLILVYTASGLPSAIFILTGFFRTLPRDLDNAARIDGAGELSVLIRVMLPLVRPALAIVTVYNIIPIWNDFFFPLVFIHQDRLKTLPLGLTVFFGEFATNWALLFAGLTLAAAPVIGLYILMSQQFIKGLTAGAVKG
jgi:raffinose/stachyose/melibiose transport system permease protein